ncbi:hypothetical protein ACFEMC_23070 [Kineococcus sp. DHX-1]|uniref:hypothetical protein n=1 Tax=Kineococcus sp. DHX-1 TaxID=3349638 RepID=UPI0036D2B7E4
MVTLFLSFAVIVLVCSLVGHLCSRSRPGSVKLGPKPAKRHRSDISWPGVLGGDAGGDTGGYVNLPDTHHHSGWGHSHSHSHDSGGGWGWGGDSGGGFGGDSGGGGGGGD